MKKHLITPLAMLGMAFIAPTARAELLVYEPFNYAPVNDEVNGRLAGKSGGLGWGGAWVDSADLGFAFIYDSRGNPADLYGGTFGLGDPNWDGVINNLPQIGNYVGLSDWSSEPGGQSRLNAYRRLAQNAGAMAADNGGVLWLSMGVHFANNGFFVTPTVMLTTTDSYLQERGRTLSSSGSGLGTALGNDFNNGTLTKDLNPLFWKSGVQGVKTTGVDIPTTSRPDCTVILKFEFGAESDTVRVWYFGEDATMDEATFNANAIAATDSIDESTLDTLTYAIDRKANAIDEIRIGTTFESVISLPPPGPVNADASTVKASPSAVPADGTIASTITVTLTDAIGVPVPDEDVTLAKTEGPAEATIDSPTTVTTDENGVATFKVRSSGPGTAVFTATRAPDTITQTASVTFVSSADADLSTVVAAPVYVDADGTSTSTITVTLLAQGDNPVAGKQVTLAGSPLTAVITPGAQTSNANGVATFTVSSTTSGTVVFTATDTSDSIVITQTASVNFVGPPHAGLSTVVASPGSVVADGTVTSTITVSLKDANEFPAAGKEVTLAAATANPSITPASAITNAAGVATFAVSSGTLGTEVFTATTGGLDITATASVEFVDPTISLAFHVNMFNSVGTPTPADPAVLDGPAGGLGETWNQFNTPTGNNNLLSSTGVKTGVSFTIPTSGRWNWGNPALRMLQAGAAQFGKGEDSTLTISGLPPGSLYDIWIASAAVNTTQAERAAGLWSTPNPTTTSDAQLIDGRAGHNGSEWEYGNNYVRFATVAVNGSGQIILNGDAADAGDLDEGAYRLPMNGFQLLPVGEALITSFGIPGWPGVIDQSAKTISLTVPAGTNLATLAPTYTLSSGTSDQTSGAPPSPTFAVQNPATYTVTDNSTEPPTINEYTVTVSVNSALGSLVIDLGTSPVGTEIKGGAFIGSGPTNLPLPTLPPGSILRSITVNAKLEATDNENYAYDLTVLLDPTPANPGEDFSVGITASSASVDFGEVTTLNWAGGAGDGGVGTSLVDTKTDTDWAAAGAIDLATTGLFLGNAFGAAPAGGTWSGTITLTYDVESTESAYQSWAGGEEFDSDKNGDGVPNGLAFLLGAANPDANALGLLPEVSENAGGLVLTFSVLNAANRGPALASVQWSNDLGQADPWATNSAAVPETTSVVNGVSFQITPNGKLNDVVATIPAAKAAGGKLFGRLSATEN